MSSFDIVSEVEMTEAKSAVDNSNRELDTRFDFRGVEASFEFAKEIITMKADADFQLNQMFDILAAKAVKRGLDVKSFELKGVVHSGKTYSQQVLIKQVLFKQGLKRI